MAELLIMPVVMGILVRLLRDYGVEALWCDQYCENLLARGFEYNGECADLVTAFEVLEHFVNPLEELDRFTVPFQQYFVFYRNHSYSNSAARSVVVLRTGPWATYWFF